MPEDQAAAIRGDIAELGKSLGARIDAHSTALTDHIEREGEVLDGLSEQMVGVRRDVEALHRVLCGDSARPGSGLTDVVAALDHTVRSEDVERPGLVARQKADDERHRASDEMKRRLTWLVRATKFVGIPLVLSIVSALTWAGSTWWHDYEDKGGRIEEHQEKIAVLETRVGHVEQMRGEMEQNQREILRALEAGGDH